MISRIFISYRRENSAGHTGRIYDRLAREFGESALFMDVDSIPLGSDFVKVLQREVSSCDVLLAIIDRYWVDAQDKYGRRRLDDSNDFVRVEISAALERDIPVIPVLVDGAAIPDRDSLPEDLKDLSRRNGLQVSHESFHADIEKLTGFLRDRFGVPQAPVKGNVVMGNDAITAVQDLHNTKPQTVSSKFRWMKITAAVICGAVVTFLTAGYISDNHIYPVSGPLMIVIVGTSVAVFLFIATRFFR